MKKIGMLVAVEMGAVLGRYGTARAVERRCGFEVHTYDMEGYTLRVIHKNVPRMINRFLDLIGERNINVEHMINKPRGEYAYTIVDLGEKIGEDTAVGIRSMPNVLRVRVI